MLLIQSNPNRMPCILTVSCLACVNLATEGTSPPMSATLVCQSAAWRLASHRCLAKREGGPPCCRPPPKNYKFPGSDTPSSFLLQLSRFSSAGRRLQAPKASQGPASHGGGSVRPVRFRPRGPAGTLGACFVPLGTLGAWFVPLGTLGAIGWIRPIFGTQHVAALGRPHPLLGGSFARSEPQELSSARRGS